MNSDQTAYKRATSVSLIGLGFQFVLAITFLLYGLIGRDHAAISASIYLGLGLVVWFGLALVFHQHSLAALEAAEEEMLRAGEGARATVFLESAGELRAAARKLEWMHRFLLPGISLAVGAVMLLAGWLRHSSGRELLDPDTFVAPSLTGWAMTIGLIVAGVSFVFARFVAGMAKQEVWANLRAGATWAVGAAVVSLLIAVAHGVSFAASEAILRTMPVIVPFVMMALGAEVFLNFVLGVYRPRAPGEFPRPAFDSRILGFLAAPDRIAESISDAINYQFGLDVSSTWFYRLLSRSIASLLFVGGLVVWLLSAVTVVEPHERGLVLRSGKLVRELDSTVALKMPWPFERIETHASQNITEVQLGSTPHSHDHNHDTPILWTEDHGVDEELFIVRASRISTGATPTDFALVAAEIPLQYVVENLEAYQWLAADAGDPNDPDRLRRDLIRSVAQREAMAVLARWSIDDVLGVRRESINQELAARVRASLASMNTDPATGEPRGAGVRVRFVGIIGAPPPFAQQVGASFEFVVNAEQRREADIENAQRTAIETLARVAGEVGLAQRIIQELNEFERLSSAGADDETVALQRFKIEALIDEAGGRAAGLLLEARADRWTRHMEQRGRATRQQGRRAMYEAAPEIYLAGLYLDALREAISNAGRVYITTFDDPRVRVSFEAVESTLGDILGETRARQE